MDSNTTPDPTGHVVDDRGASLVEYALLLALITVVCIGALTFFGSAYAGSLTDSSSSIVVSG